MANEFDLQRLAARQHGLDSRTQLLRLGYSPRQISDRVVAGRWRRIAPSVYDIAPGRTDPRRSLHAAVLATGGWASHVSAAVLLGLHDAPGVVPEIVVPEGKTPLGLNATVHQSRFVAARERTTVDFIACTTPVRTLLDLASAVDELTLDDAVSRALTAGRTTIRRLDRYLSTSMVGRRGVDALRSAIDRHRDQLHATQSLLELIVDHAVRDSTIVPPHRQFPVAVGDHVFYLDLAWPSAKVFVEADGFAFHSTRRQFQRDRERQNLLVVAGWLPLRYTWAVATTDPTLVVKQLRKVLPGRAA